MKLLRRRLDIVDIPSLTEEYSWNEYSNYFDYNEEDHGDYDDSDDGDEGEECSEHFFSDDLPWELDENLDDDSPSEEELWLKHHHEDMVSERAVWQSFMGHLT